MGSDPRIRAVVAEGVTGLQVADHGWLPHGIDGALQRGMELGAATPASYGLAYQDVAFRAGDGVGLSAWYLPARNGAAVVLLPGAGSTRTAVLGQAAVLARHGYGALLVDTRGHGRSGGHAMDFGWWGGRDIAAAVSYLARHGHRAAGLGNPRNRLPERGAQALSLIRYQLMAEFRTPGIGVC